MKLRANRKVERSAVNATRTFFESQGCVFQEIDLANDYGKDAYVDLVASQDLTGMCVALQIKGGISYRTRNGYSIPIGPHEQIWRESTLPIAGIVHDPESERLYWCSITKFLKNRSKDRRSTIPVPLENQLTPSTLQAFREEMAAGEGGNRLVASLFDLCDEAEERQMSGILDCFALGRSDARVLILLRYLLGLLSDGPLKAAIYALSHVTPHPDILWSKSNWVPEDICTKVRRHLRWSRDEIIRFFGEVSWGEWQRGDVGEDLYMLLDCDPKVHVTMQQVLFDALRALNPPNQDVAFTALYLTLYWAQENGMNVYDRIVADLPEVRELPLASELEVTLEEQGCVILFE